MPAPGLRFSLKLLRGLTVPEINGRTDGSDSDDFTICRWVESLEPVTLGLPVLTMDRV
jgi:hypothetical protein